MPLYCPVTLQNNRIPVANDFDVLNILKPFILFSPFLGKYKSNFPLRLTSIASQVTTSTSYVSFVLLLAIFQLPIQLSLFTFLSQIVLTIAYPSTLVYHMCDWPALTIFSSLRHALLVKYQSLVA